MNSETQSRNSLVVRAVDAIDRSHARVASRIHDVRNNLRASALRGLDVAESAVTNAISRARDAITRVDAVGADAVNRAQGVFGGALERVRARAA